MNYEHIFTSTTVYYKEPSEHEVWTWKRQLLVVKILQISKAIDSGISSHKVGTRSKMCELAIDWKMKGQLEMEFTHVILGTLQAPEFVANSCNN
jgi:hypothetical protein